MEFLTLLCETKNKLKEFLANSSDFVLQVSEDTKISSSSSEDVLPPQPIVEEKSSEVYTFQYVCSSPQVEPKFKDFKKLYGRMPSFKAYKQTTCFAKKKVRSCRLTDRLNMLIEGEWSGSDVKMKEITPYSIEETQLWSFGIRGKLEKVSAAVDQLVSSKYFTHVITISVIANTVVLALDHYGISTEMESALYYLNLVFTVEFACEMALKLIAMGFKHYFQDTMNYLDASVVLFSVFEIIVFSDSASGFSAFRTVRIFRTFKILRVARLFRYLEYMSKLLKVIGISISISFYLSLIHI